jgi:hypothetical protein
MWVDFCASNVTVSPKYLENAVVIDENTPRRHNSGSGTPRRSNPITIEVLTEILDMNLHQHPESISTQALAFLTRFNSRSSREPANTGTTTERVSLAEGLRGARVPVQSADMSVKKGPSVTAASNIPVAVFVDTDFRGGGERMDLRSQEAAEGAQSSAAVPWAILPPESVGVKENMQQPSAWNGVTLGAGSDGIGSAEPAVPVPAGSLGFSVFVDEGLRGNTTLPLQLLSSA